MEELQNLLQSINSPTKVPAHILPTICKVEQPDNQSENEPSYYSSPVGGSPCPNNQSPAQIPGQVRIQGNSSVSVFIKREPMSPNPAQSPEPLTSIPPNTQANANYMNAANANVIMNGHVNNDSNKNIYQNDNVKVTTSSVANNTRNGAENNSTRKTDSYNIDNAASQKQQQSVQSPLNSKPVSQPGTPKYGPGKPDSPNTKQAKLPPKLTHAQVEMMIREAKIPITNAERQELVDDVINTVSEAHQETCIYTKEKVLEKVEHYKEIAKNMPKDMASMPMDPKSMPPPGKMWETFIKGMVPVISRVVRFCKQLPGFMELSSDDDHIRLIKQGSFEVVCLRYMPLFCQEGMFIPSMEKKIPRKMVHQMPMGMFFEEQFKFAEKFRMLGLDDTGVAFLTAIEIMNPDVDGLCNKKAISRLRSLFLQSMFVYLTRNMSSDEANTKFIGAMNLLPQLRDINISHAQELNNMKMDVPNHNLPELHKQVYQ